MFNASCSRRDLLILGGTGLLRLPGLMWTQSVLADDNDRLAYKRAVLASAPTAYWRLGESRGPVADDTTGNGNGGRYIGRLTFGQKGAIAVDPDSAIGLDGPRARSYIEVRNQQAFSVSTSGNGLTVEVWMRPDVLEFKGEGRGSADDFIHWLGKGEKGRYEWGFRFYGHRAERPNRISAYVWNPDGKLGAGAYVEERLTSGVWIYLVATFDDPRKPNAQVRLYKDGTPSPHNKSPGTLYRNYHVTPQHGLAPLRLGTRDLRDFLTGGLDEVAIYPRVLDAEEILRHWSVARIKSAVFETGGRGPGQVGGRRLRD
jgi:hypothetical protein